MKVFISSLIAGSEDLRRVCRAAVVALRHEPVMAEDFGARPDSPQIACLKGLRSADLVVLVLGAHYGSPQSGSGLSATHEEYREARGNNPVLAFVQDGVTPDAKQAEFIREVQAWEDGLFRASFRGADDLRDSLTRALHDYDLAHATGPVDHEAIVRRAIELLPAQDRRTMRAATLSIALAGGPARQILRPAEIEASDLAEALNREALFGSARVFFRSLGVETEIEETALVLTQEGGGRIQLDEDGAILLQLALDDPQQHRRRHMTFPAIIEEDALARLSTGLGYAAWLLDHIDRTQRLTHIACAVRIDGGSYMAWRTQQEQDASPNGGTVGIMGNEERVPVSIHKPRPALRLDRQRLAEDLLIRLRRQWKQP